MSKNKVGNFLINSLPDEEKSVEVIVKDENIWISQKGMAELFGVDRTGIERHLKNIFSEGELIETMVYANFAQPLDMVADEKAIFEYDEFNKFQKIISDFDKEIMKHSPLEDNDE